MSPGAWGLVGESSELMLQLAEFPRLLRAWLCQII